MFGDTILPEIGALSQAGNHRFSRRRSFAGVPHRSLSRALSLEGEAVPIVQHQHVLVLPRPRLRSYRRPLHTSPASGRDRPGRARYRLPRPVLERVLAEAAPLQNGEAVVALATFLGRFQTGPRCLGRAFPIDRRALVGHHDLGLSEAKVRGGIKALLEIGFLEREEPPAGLRYQCTAEGLHRRAILFRIAPAYLELFAAANRTPRKAQDGHGPAGAGRRPLPASPMPATLSRFSWSPPTSGDRSPKGFLPLKTVSPLGERSKELPGGSFTLPETCGNSGLEAALKRLGEALGVRRDLECGGEKPAQVEG